MDINFSHNSCLYFYPYIYTKLISLCALNVFCVFYFLCILPTSTTSKCFVFQNLAANLHGAEYPIKVLNHLTVIDTPGIMENFDQQMQGHHYIEVFQWFISRASLIFFVFDPSKLDAGKQLREVFRRLKGHEGKLRIILNKADSTDGGVLMRSYGAFCWNLKGLIPSLADPPRVYLVSCWSKPYEDVQYRDVLATEEHSLVEDIQQAIDTRCEAVMTSFLAYALSVETHAVIVDAYLNAYDDHKHSWLRWKNVALQSDVVDCPDLFNIPQRVGAKTSNHDGFLNVHDYRQFFLANPLCTFYRASHRRNGVIFSGATILETAQEAIKTTIPNLLAKQRALRTESLANGYHKPETKGIAILSNTMKNMLSPRKQLRTLLDKSPLSSSWIPSPLGFVTEKVQSALKSY